MSEVRGADEDGTAATAAQAQRLLLRALLSDTPLPGGTATVRLPDMAWVLARRPILVAAENVAGEEVVEGLDLPVEVLSTSAIHARAVDADVAYLAFDAPRWTADVLQVVLQARLASHDPSRHSLGLSGVQARFRDVKGSWRLAADPVLFAM